MLVIHFEMMYSIDIMMVLPKIITDAYFIFYLRQMLLKLHNQNQRENSLIHYIVQKLIICAVTFEHANTPHATKEMLL